MPSTDLMTGEHVQVAPGAGTFVMDPKVLLSVEILNAYDNAERKVWAQQALQDDAFRNNI